MIPYNNYPPGVTGCEPEIIGEDLRCPDCEGELDIDENSAQCHKCKKLWPLTYLMEG